MSAFVREAHITLFVLPCNYQQSLVESITVNKVVASAHMPINLHPFKAAQQGLLWSRLVNERQRQRSREAGKLREIKQAVNIYQVSKGGDGPVNKIPGDAVGLPSITTIDSTVRPED